MSASFLTSAAYNLVFCRGVISTSFIAAPWHCLKRSSAIQQKMLFGQRDRARRRCNRSETIIMGVSCGLLRSMPPAVGCSTEAALGQICQDPPRPRIKCEASRSRHGSTATNPPGPAWPCRSLRYRIIGKMGLARRHSYSAYSDAQTPTFRRDRKRTDLNFGERRALRRYATPSGGAKSGPCLTDAAPEAAPDRAVRERPLRRSPNVCRGDLGGNLPRWFHAHLHSSLAAPALRPTHCLRLEQHR